MQLSTVKSIVSFFIEVTIPTYLITRSSNSFFKYSFFSFRYFETSASTGEGVEKMFVDLLETLSNKKKLPLSKS